MLNLCKWSLLILPILITYTIGDLLIHEHVEKTSIHRVTISSLSICCLFYRRLIKSNSKSDEGLQESVNFQSDRHPTETRRRGTHRHHQKVFWNITHQKNLLCWFLEYNIFQSFRKRNFFGVTNSSVKAFHWITGSCKSFSLIIWFQLIWVFVY